MNATSDYNARILGRWIEESGLNDSQFARAVGCSRMTIWRLRRGAPASIGLLGRCAAVCSKPVADLLPGEIAKTFGLSVTSP